MFESRHADMLLLPLSRLAAADVAAAAADISYRPFAISPLFTPYAIDAAMLPPISFSFTPCFFAIHAAFSIAADAFAIFFRCCHVAYMLFRAL